MSNNISVHDLHEAKDFLSSYDFAFFTLGYESRCTAAATFLTEKKIKASKIIIISFPEDGCIYKDNKQIYNSLNLGDHLKYYSADNDEEIYSFLTRETQDLKKISIFIDYSSMSRIWYTAILSWAKLFSEKKEIILDFIYTLGDYEISDTPMVIQGIHPIPGCEGNSLRQSESVAIFGLGFHGYTALCVLDQLEPDIVYSLVAYPAGSDAYGKRSFDDNKDLLAKAQKKLQLPLHSVENTYRYLSEIVASELGRHREVTLIPMGPKPHILSSILVALSFPEVTCLRVSHTNDSINVLSRGEFVLTRLTFENVEF